METQNEVKTRKVRSVLLGIATALIINIVYGLIFFIVSLIIYLLYLVPIVKNLLDLLFAIRKDSPDLFAAFMALVLCFIVIPHILGKFSKNSSEQIIIGRTASITIAIVHIPSMIINLFTEGASPLVNIMMLILAAFLFFKAYKD